MQKHLLIVLTSFAAEGCPRLAFLLARFWLEKGISVSLLVLEDKPNDMRPQFDSLKIPIYWYFLGRGLSRYLRLVWISFRLCSLLKPHSVLSFPLGWHAFIAIGAKLAAVRRICAHVGNLPPVWTGKAFLKFKLLVQMGRPFTHRLLCCSDYIRVATVRDFGIAERETKTVFNACCLEEFTSVSLRPKFAFTSKMPLLGMVARLEMHKDQPTLIRSISLLKNRGIDVSLWLIGEGSQRFQLEELINALSLNDRVQLLGSRHDIPELLAQLDLFVFSARPNEGFGIALAEAMAAKVPIVATDVGACREVLKGGSCGLLVKPNSADALADGIQAVLQDPVKAQKRADFAYQRALRDFSLESMAKAYGEELGLT